MLARLSLLALLIVAAAACDYDPADWCKSHKIAKECGVVPICLKYVWSRRDPRERDASARPAAAAASPVQLTLYYESLCGGCKSFIGRTLYPVWQKLGAAVMAVRLVPYGNARETQNGTAWTFECQHGKEECVGNLIETCAINKLQTVDKWLPYLQCIENDYSERRITTVAQSCAHSHGVDYNAIDQCTKSAEGNAMEHRMAQLTDALNPPHKYVPWITINGQHTEQIQHKAEVQLLKFICDTYTGPVPPSCKSEPLPSKCYK